jgi:hypothetical protein
VSQQPTQAEVDALLRALVRILAGVAVLALVFTAVNVTLFATVLLSPQQAVHDVQHESVAAVDLRGGGGYLRPSITWILEV